jgi:hypothetical protein
LFLKVRISSPIKWVGGHVINITTKDEQTGKGETGKNVDTLGQHNRKGNVENSLAEMLQCKLKHGLCEGTVL